MRKNQVDADSPSVNASSTKETVAKGGNTHGVSAVQWNIECIQNNAD